MYLTTKDLASRWGIHPGTLENWRQKKYGPRYIKIGRSVRYLIRAVEAWEKRKDR